MAIVIAVILAIIFGAMYFFVSVPNRMIKVIHKETEKTVREVVNLSGKTCDDQEKLFEIMCQVIGLNKNTLPNNLIKHMKSFSTCIEAVCSNILFNVRLHQVTMNLRCAQCIGMINDCLEYYGVESCPLNLRESMLKNLGLFDLYKQHPNLFKFREPQKEKKQNLTI